MSALSGLFKFQAALVGIERLLSTRKVPCFREVFAHEMRNVCKSFQHRMGCGRPTVLLSRDAADLKFDVRGQRCLVYKSIKHLEEMLRKELEALAAS